MIFWLGHGVRKKEGMTVNQKIMKQLHDKMLAEQAAYRSWLLEQSPEEILNHTHEYTVRQDILYALEEVDLTESQMEALLHSPSPLADIYKEFSNIDFDYLDTLKGCIENRADWMIEKTFLIPVYRHTDSYAKSHGEAGIYWTSFHQNVACKKSIEEAVSHHFHGNCLDAETAEFVVEKYGLERVKYVLASSILAYSSDGRISRENRIWAASQNAVQDIDQQGNRLSLEYVLDSIHPRLLDAFATQIRKMEPLDFMEGPTLDSGEEAETAGDFEL